MLVSDSLLIAMMLKGFSTTGFQPFFKVITQKEIFKVTFKQVTFSEFKASLRSLEGTQKMSKSAEQTNSHNVMNMVVLRLTWP